MEWKLHRSALILQHPNTRNRGLYLTLCVMYCIIHKLVHFYSNTFVPKQLCALHSSQGHQFIIPFAKTNAFLYSFVPLVCSAWNALPADISSSPSLTLGAHAQRALL